MIDWLLSKSAQFKEMTSIVKDHKTNTRSSFVRVKQKHRDYEAKMREHEARIRELEGLLQQLQELEDEVPVPTKRKKKKH